MRTRLRIATVLLVLAGAGATLVADTLYLRNGTRLDGEVLSLRDDVIEFAEDRGAGQRRVRQFDRSDVLRIDFDLRRPDPPYGRGRGGRGAGLRERAVTVRANEPWTDTGVDVRFGQEIYFEAAGEIRWGPGDRRDGPDGERNSPFNPNRPMSNRAGGALIGRIGETNDYFFVGTTTEAIRVRASGRLFLGINDDVLTDNAGNFRVVIYY